MKTEQLLFSDSQMAVENIKMSENTKALLKCRAMLADIYNTVIGIHANVYDDGTAELITSKFTERYSALDKELCSLLATMIHTTTIDSSFKEL